MISFYKKYLSLPYHTLGRSLFGTTFACRFTPTCSVYAQQALQQYGIIRGAKLALTRFLRCNPLFPGGSDPVPDKIK